MREQTGEDHSHTNQLIHASSPYLLQHAHNPVDWYPWGDEALDRAVRENKPLLISIGYSACHWCHVMERETYSSPEVAAYMNAHFVSVKVDREEHPDVDQIYMHASQLISGAGGWPLNAFALPDGSPFYAVTYLPKDRWMALLTEVRSLFEGKSQAVREQADALVAGIRNQGLLPPPAPARGAAARAAYRDLWEQMQPYLDTEAGGLGRAPKFPMPDCWEFLLEYHYLTGEEGALEAVTRTLDKMAAGGIYDQLGGGFCRYATDRAWDVPHFEKMLYDNGQLVSLYAHAYQCTGNPRYAVVITETLAFVERELSDREGGFYCSLNADSEGEEGKFYVWREAEIDAMLGKRSARLFKEHFQVTPEGNWEHGLNILHTHTSTATAEQAAKLDQGRRTLFRARERRVHPSLDDKILTSWNALMIRGFLDGFHALGDPAYLNRALRCARFIEQKMLRADGSLYRGYRQGTPSIAGVLEDYALLAEALLDLYEATFEIRWLSRANSLARYGIAHFGDPATGLFFFASDQTEHLVARKLETEDNVIPSSNAVMAHVLFRLGIYFSQDAYLTSATRMLERMEASIPRAVPYYARWARLLGMVRLGVFEVAVVGEGAPGVAGALRRHYLPDCLLLGGHAENLPLLEGKTATGGTHIYVCRDRVCRRPVATVEEAMAEIRARPEA